MFGVITMLSNYPEVLSGEQVRCILHISKRKCAWMLNNGFIKCQNNGKKSRKYSVLTADLEEYIKDSELHPEKYVTPYGEFSAVKYAQNRKPRPRKIGFPSSLPVGFRAWLKQEFAPLPDAFTIKEVIATTGYSDNSVDRWLHRGWLKFINTQSGKIIPKQWLIDFYCNYGYTIAKMSDKHIQLMQKYFKQHGGKQPLPPRLLSEPVQMRLSRS